MALPWLVKGGIDAALYGGAASGSLLRFPLLILAAAALQGFSAIAGASMFTAFRAAAKPICAIGSSPIYSACR